MVWRGILQVCQGTVNLLLTLALLLWGGFGSYALWDNAQVLASVEDVQTELLAWKPKPAEDAHSEPDNGESFAQLRRINPDVCAWIVMDGTRIDYPILQGPNNLSYISRDVFGNFALAGSIFLDSRNDRDFEENYSLLYGHHMADGKMFGDLDLYKEEAFFQENQTGQLLLPEGAYRLDVAACLLTGASDPEIFDPEQVRSQRSRFTDFVREKAIFLREELLTDDGKYLALSTCATEFTDARTVVIVRMEPVGQEE